MTEGIFDLSSELLDVRSIRFALSCWPGGKGTRLAPFTSILPKPLMPIGETTILELVLGQLRASGISEVALCVGYLSHLIKAVIGNRAHGGVGITYVEEESALGTAGPLRLVPGLTSSFIAMNGDVLTTLDYNALLEHHREHGNLLTIATRERPIKIDYGVLHLGLNGSASRVCALRREARGDVGRQHGDLRTRARGAAVHPGRVLRRPGPRARPAGGRRAGRRVSVRRAVVRHRSARRLRGSGGSLAGIGSRSADQAQADLRGVVSP